MPAGGSALESVLSGMAANAQTPAQQQLAAAWKAAGRPISGPTVQAMASAGMLPAGYGTTDLSGLKYLAAILGPAAGFALLAAVAPAATGGAAVGDLASLGTTVPAGAAIAPSVDLGVNALDPLLATIPTAASTLPSATMTAPLAAGPGATTAPAGTIASLTDPAATDTATNVAADQSLGTTGYFDNAGNWITGGTGTNPASFGGATSSVLTSPAGVGSIVQGGLGLLGSYLQSKAASNATAAQLKAAEEALAVQAQIQNQNVALNTGEFNINTGLTVAEKNQALNAYNQAQQELAPYRQAGAAAASTMGYHLGWPGYQQGNTQVVNAPPPYQPIAPLATPSPLVSSPITYPGGPPAPTTPPTPTGTTAMPGATVGEQRYVNGQLATWDGTGWMVQ